MRYRKPRIAWFVVLGLAAVLLIVLWVRSYWRMDSWLHPERGVLPNIYSSSLGDIHVNWDAEAGSTGWHHWSGPHSKSDLRELDGRSWIRYRFTSQGGACAYIGFPHWFAVAVFATLAGVPWIHLRSRFSLRTLLIATTLVAVVLGLVYAPEVDSQCPPSWRAFSCAVEWRAWTIVFSST